MVGGQKQRHFNLIRCWEGEKMIKKRASTCRLCSTRLSCYSTVIVSSVSLASASNFIFTIKLRKPRSLPLTRQFHSSRCCCAVDLILHRKKISRCRCILKCSTCLKHIFQDLYSMLNGQPLCTYPEK